MIKLSRKFLVILVAIILGINLPQLDAQESGDLQYNTYANARFNYTIKYPLNILIPQGESANGDGQKFISPDGQAILTVWGEYNALDESLKNRYNEVLNKLSGSITYKILKDNVFVILCYQGNKIFYQKTILINSMFKTFTITYSKSYRQLFDPIVKEISSSFSSPSARSQTEFYGLPDGAQVVEIQPIKSERHPQRALILWVLYPQKNPRPTRMNHILVLNLREGTTTVALLESPPRRAWKGARRQKMGVERQMSGLQVTCQIRQLSSDRQKIPICSEYRRSNLR